MRTSQSQYEMMIDFMEKNGDLSKPPALPGVYRNRNFILTKWTELCDNLNKEGTGDPRSEAKWRKVWSDYKNNTKKKYIKINKAKNAAGGYVMHSRMTNLENRVIKMIDMPLPTDVEEASSNQAQDNVVTETNSNNYYQVEHAVKIEDTFSLEENTDDWNIASTSRQTSVSSPVEPTPEASIDAETQMPLTVLDGSRRLPWTAADGTRRQLLADVPKKKRKVLFISNRRAREYTRERDRVYEDLERERLRLRDRELDLQAQWLEVVRDGLNIVKRYVERNHKE